jgi:hypothetical protein
MLTLAGGETPINNSIVLYDALKKEFPEFIDEIDKKVGELGNKIQIRPNC